MKTAIILTVYNRPQLVADAIASVREQTTQDWRLYLMDDGCDAETRAAINQALGTVETAILSEGQPLWSPTGRPLGAGGWSAQVVWRQGPARTAQERWRTIPYSASINLALNCLLSDEEYVCYLCDDDYLMPDAVRGRAVALDANPQVGVVFGRLRSIRFGADGKRNVWKGTMGRPEAGRRWVEPDGERQFFDGGSARHYYKDGGTDPDTGLDYVEEGYWLPQPIAYGCPYMIDHNQILHRVSLLTREPMWMWERIPGSPFIRYWPEDRATNPVGDAPFFARLSQHGLFYGVDVWTVTKRYHIHSDGMSQAERRE